MKSLSIKDIHLEAHVSTPTRKESVSNRTLLVLFLLSEDAGQAMGSVDVVFIGSSVSKTMLLMLMK